VSEYLNERNNLRGLDVDGRIILKLILQDYAVRACSDSSGSEQVRVTVSRKFRKFLDQLSNY
jgi:hypothetical protein